MSLLSYVSGQVSTRKRKDTGCSPPNRGSIHQRQSWLDLWLFQDDRTPGYWYLNSERQPGPSFVVQGYSGHGESSCPIALIRRWLLLKLRSTRELQVSRVPSSFPKILGSTCWNTLSISAAEHLPQESGRGRCPCAQAFPACCASPGMSGWPEQPTSSVFP